VTAVSGLRHCDLIFGKQSIGRRTAVESKPNRSCIHRINRRRIAAWVLLSFILALKCDTVRHTTSYSAALLLPPPPRFPRRRQTKYCSVRSERRRVFFQNAAAWLVARLAEPCGRRSECRCARLDRRPSPVVCVSLATVTRDDFQPCRRRLLLRLAFVGPGRAALREPITVYSGMDGTSLGLLARNIIMR